MFIYTLTEVDTRTGFECNSAEPFFSIGMAQKAMEKRFDDLIKQGGEGEIKVNYSIIDNGGNKVYLDIHTKEISAYEPAVAMLHDKIVEIYGEDCFGDDLLLKLVSENSEDYVLSRCIFGNVESFLSDTIIGEGLYQNATEKLGGDPSKTEVIIDFFNENEKFVEMGQQKNNCEYMSDNWLFAMCAICKGDEDLITNCRIIIDEGRKDKVFFDLKKAQKELFCKNHRELSSSLTDEAYASVCQQICGEPYFSEGFTPCRKMIESCYVEFYKRAYKIAKMKGFDCLLGDNSIFEVREDSPVNYKSDSYIYQLVIVGDAVETAQYIDFLESSLAE